MPDHASMFDVALNRRGRIWAWRVCTAGGNVIMQGSESTRSADTKLTTLCFFCSLPRPIGRGSLQRSSHRLLVGTGERQTGPSLAFRS
jgi:hypothetical protein